MLDFYIEWLFIRGVEAKICVTYTEHQFFINGKIELELFFSSKIYIKLCKNSKYFITKKICRNIFIHNFLKVCYILYDSSSSLPNWVKLNCKYLQSVIQHGKHGKLKVSVKQGETIFNSKSSLIGRILYSNVTKLGHFGVEKMAHVKNHSKNTLCKTLVVEKTWKKFQQYL